MMKSLKQRRELFFASGLQTLNPGYMSMIIESVVNQACGRGRVPLVFSATPPCAASILPGHPFELDSRVDAHLDGLLCAGEGGWKICLDALEDGEAGEFFAAAFLAFESGCPGKDR